MNRKTITEEQLAYAIKVWDENPHLTKEEKAAMVNKKFNTNFNESAFRKRVKDYHNGLVKGVEKEQGSAMIERLAKARLNVKVERKIVAHERKEVNAGIREMVDRKLILDEFTKHIKDMKFGTIKKPTQKDLVMSYVPVRLFVKGDDHHRGTLEDSKAQDNFYFNVWCEAKILKLKEINLVFLGDEIEGWLHTNTLRSTGVTPEKQLITWVKDTIKGIDSLAKDFNSVNVYMVTSSNHTQPRHLGANRNTFPDSDLLNIASDMLQQAFRESEHVSIFAQETFTNVDFDGKSVAMTHGSLGFEEKKNLLVNAYRGHDLVLKAHTHVFDVTEPERGFRVVTIPAFKSWVSEYELNNGYIKIDDRGLNPEEYSWGNRYLIITLDADDNSIGIDLKTFGRSK